MQRAVRRVRAFRAGVALRPTRGGRNVPDADSAYVVDAVMARASRRAGFADAWSSVGTATTTALAASCVAGCAVACDGADGGSWSGVNWGAAAGASSVVIVRAGAPVPPWLVSAARRALARLSQRATRRWVAARWREIAVRHARAALRRRCLRAWRRACAEAAAALREVRPTIVAQQTGGGTGAWR